MTDTSARLMLSREALEAREAEWLAQYAMKSRDTRGRVHAEPEDPYRTVYRRDRDRIIHSTAFRRLEYKTQVFVNHEGDYYRTRLTHTLEVAQIAGSIARTLRLNEDLVETMALAHDMGHPPFGHAGEETLRGLMKDHGGFDHNLQGLRIADYLEQRYPGFPGLNLTWEVREGINKHRTPFDHADYTFAQLEPDKWPLLEGQLVDVSDEIAYDNHDLDDGLTSGMIHEDELDEIPMWRAAASRVRAAHPDVNPEIRKHLIVRMLINQQATDLAMTSAQRLDDRQLSSVEAVQGCRERLMGFSPAMAEERKALKSFLWQRLYRHYRVVRMSDKARRILTELFRAYLGRPEQLPPSAYGRLNEERIERVLCDYIAGMTDRYAMDEYQKLFDPHTRV